MKAAVNATYGPAEAVVLEERPMPIPGPGQILVSVEAAGVTTADWRIRAAEFPGGFALVGRLMFGLTKPRQPIRGMDFAGRVRAVGAGVRRFALGDAVVGIVPDGGAHAEALVVAEDGIVVHRPDALEAAEAAALPFGAITATAFLQDFARVSAGQKVLILGASGTVGGYAVQIAAASGAKVTAVGGPASLPRLKEFGAAHVIDYTAQALDAEGRDYDLVFDTAGILSYGAASKLLKRNGLFLPLEFGVAEVWPLLAQIFGRRPRISLRVSGETRDALQSVVTAAARGGLRPVIGARLPFESIVDAHRRVESRHAGGPVVVEMGQGNRRSDAA